MLSNRLNKEAPMIGWKDGEVALWMPAEVPWVCGHGGSPNEALRMGLAALQRPTRMLPLRDQTSIAPKTGSCYR
jgi:hypothetical protein